MRTALVCVALAALAFPQTRRNLQVEDVHRLKTVADPQVSPDGRFVAYTLATADREADKSDTDVWMVSWDGATRTRATASPESENTPRWSPDNRHLAFLSARAAKEKGSQIWLLPRAGGEAVQLTEIEGSVSDYAWSPDSKQLALVVATRDEPPAKPGDKPKTPKPIVIDRYHFKQDMEGYLTKKPAQIWLYDVEAKKAERLTRESFPESSPVWSPDSSKIAYLSERAGLDAKYPSWQLCVATAKPGVEPRVVTDTERMPGRRGASPQWSSDGTRLFFLQGLERKLRAYNRLSLAAVPAAGGSVQELLPNYPRSIGNLQRLSTGELSFLSTDDMTELPLRYDLGGAPRKMIDGKLVVAALHEAGGHTALLAASDNVPPEIHAVENGALRALTAHNSDWLAQVQLG